MQGELEGSKLEMLPASMTTWADWKSRYPETTLLAMKRTADRFLKTVWENSKIFVFGIPEASLSVGIDKLQKSPVVKASDEVIVTHGPAGGTIQAFSTELDGKKLDFSSSGEGTMKDAGTQSEWDVVRGTCLTGALKGKQLKEIPGTISYLRAWKAFFPE